MTSREFFLQSKLTLNSQEDLKLGQRWLYYQNQNNAEKIQLLRVPSNQIETIVLLSKLDTLSILPFTLLSAEFQEENIFFLVKYLENGKKNNQSKDYEIVYCLNTLSDLSLLEPILLHADSIVCWEIDSKIPHKMLDNSTTLLQVRDKNFKVIILNKIFGLSIVVKNIQTI